MITEKRDLPNELSQGRRVGVTEPKVVDTADLFRGDSEIMIRHDGAIYRLKITRQGKLILNK